MNEVNNNNEVTDGNIGNWNKEQRTAGEKPEVPEKLGEGELEFEYKERLARKHNIMVAGVRTVGKDVKRGLVDILEETLETPIRVAMVRAVEGKVLATMHTMKDKLAVMKRKGKLRGLQVWVADDWTKREKEIQEWLEKEANWERANGTAVQVRYMRIKKGEIWYEWSEKEGMLVPKRNDESREGNRRA